MTRGIILFAVAAMTRSCLDGSSVPASMLCQDAVPPRLSTELCAFDPALPVLHQLQPATAGCVDPDGWGACENVDPEQLPLMVCCAR
jgi:hypothetical protein